MSGWLPGCRCSCRCGRWCARMSRRRSGQRARAEPAAIWRSRAATCGRRRRWWWRSAGCRAPASRRWRARWRRGWARRPGALVLRSDEIAQAPARRRAGTAAAAGGLYGDGGAGRCSRRCCATRRAWWPRRARGDGGRDVHRSLAARPRCGRWPPGGARFVGVWLEAPLAVLERRMAARQRRRLGCDRRGAAAAARGAIPGAGDWAVVPASDREQALAARPLRFARTSAGTSRNASG